MNNKLIMTYGLSTHQNQLLINLFAKENVLDTTSCFTDLLAIPAAAVVVEPSNMNEDEVLAFNEVFEHDLNTWIVLLEEMQEMRFMYIHEQDEENLTDTIEGIQERLSLPEEYEAAKQRRDDILDRITAIMNYGDDLSYRDQIAMTVNTCIPYEKLTQLIGRISMLDARSKYPYRVELNSILLATMIAHKIIDIDEINFGNDVIGYDRRWIETLSRAISRHYKKTRSKNGPRRKN